MTFSSPETPRAGRELVILPTLPRGKLRRDLRNFGIAAACLVAATALGWGAGARLGAAAPAATEVKEKADVAQLLWQSQATQRQETRQLADEVRALKASLGGLQASLDRGRPAEDAKSFKASLDAVKQGLDTAKSDTAGALAQFSGKLDRADQVAAQKLAQIVERLDRLERRPDAMPVGSIAPQPPMRPVAQLPPQPAGMRPQAQWTQAQGTQAQGTQAQGTQAQVTQAQGTQAQVPQAQGTQAQMTQANAQSPQKAPVQGWVLRDVYDGIAVVEGRGGYREVAVGEAIPGVGRVEAIERHGRHWVVVTSQGVIASELN